MVASTYWIGRFLLLGLVACFTGCARYEYDVVRPTELAQHVGEKKDVVVRLDPLEYRLVSFDSHLVVRVYNPTDNSVRLLADRSFSVDPNGQSHPLRGQAIASHSFVKLILPPVPAEIEPSGPRIGIGIGIGGVFGSAWGPRRGFYGGGFYSPVWDDGFYGGFYDRPVYYTVYDGGEFYWDWAGETDARLSLTFQIEDQKPFNHEFVFHRRKI